MSPLLESLVAEIHDPYRADLKTAATSIQLHLRALSRSAQRELLTEVTQWRNSLAPSNDRQWALQQVVFQLLWQAIGAPTIESADECALRDEIKNSNPPRAAQPDVAESAG